ncbi:MAG: hypothetical protein WC842_00455 [Candidatus Paceibacterota bacterium]|jgi:hypothetical protein
MKVKNLLFHFQKTVEWSLVAKCACLVFLALYVFVHGGMFSWFVWFIASLWFFYSENIERRSYKYSYGVYVILLFLYGINIKNSVFGDIIFFFLASFLLALWVGLIRFFFKENEIIMDVFHSILIFLSLLFSLLFPTFFSIVFASISTGMLVYEHLSMRKFSWRPRMMLASIVLGLFMCELLLITQLLSLHVIALTGIMSLAVLVIRNLLVAHFSGTLTQHLLFQNIIIFITACIILFATGQWVI